MNLLFIIFPVISLLFSAVNGQSCARYTFSGNRIFPSCTDLPYLNSFLHWDYNQSSSSVKIAYRASGGSSGKWVAWALNPTGRGMVGAQTLVAFRQSNGAVKAYTSPVSVYRTGLNEGELSFPVRDLTATYVGNEVIIFATLVLRNFSSSFVNMVWQEGPLSGDSPAIHPVSGPNILTMRTLNLHSGAAVSGSGDVSPGQRARNIHGVLNAVGWGVLLPIGVIIARYLKVFNSAEPAWFYLHVSCQFAGYMIGLAGWATGIRLGGQSPGVTYTAHRVIGTIVFCLATVQVTALLLRPKKDHKFRFYWNIYHHSIGYSLIILSIINIFKGLAILNPDHKWKKTYKQILISLAVIAAVLEIYTWIIVVLNRKKKMKMNQQHHKLANGFNGNRI